MADQKKGQDEGRAGFPNRVGSSERRRIRTRDSAGHGAWFGLGTFGIVGWSVTVPTILGVFAGVWIDSRWPGRHSWTLMLLAVGLVAGCLNAWLWLKRNREAISREQDHEG
ncbi:MAG: AtpZ/AtpI family protein [Desulfovibrionaceae bacterium]|nr:AtpZ/AtpI family protein [Desulfovibrionaceae bacterium]